MAYGKFIRGKKKKTKGSKSKGKIYHPKKHNC